MTVHDLDTPAPVVDIDIVEQNLAKMQSYCDSHGLALRPHIKTHKIPHLAHRQVQLGACGITCQKLGEAEVMVAVGLTDILISYPLIGELKAKRLAVLAGTAKMTVAIDSDVALATATSAALSSGAEIGVLVEFDSGAKRTGVVSVEQALALAAQITETKGLRFDGLMTYPSTVETGLFVAGAKQAFDRAGISILVVSGGGTPRAWEAHTILGLTEVRVGTYVYFDRSQVEQGSATLYDCALHVYATVVSRPTEDRAILDCGSKSLSSDHSGTGYGLIREYPGAVIERLYEEHALVNLANSAAKPKIGERVRVLPNHACVVTNLHDEIFVASGENWIDTWKVAARGKTV